MCYKQGSSDRFSLLGLLSVIRMIDEDLAMLALGQDLTTLGLKLDQAGSDLHKTFLSPWADHQLPGNELDCNVPACYLNPPEKLRPEYLTKFKDETLFYLFYSMPGAEAQHLAGYELTRRGLVWHKDHKVWMMRLPNAQLQKSPEGWERGSYIFFDTDEWKYSRKDNFLLNLCIDGKADYLISGDKDLLSLNKVENTEIITLKELLNKMKNQK